MTDLTTELPVWEGESRNALSLNVYIGHVAADL